MEKSDLVKLLPYGSEFLFVDRIIDVDEKSIVGKYKFEASATFYRGHFKDRPVTPGVLLVECMAQIGVVCLGTYLTGGNSSSGIAMTSVEAEFLKAVFPGEEVTVESKKIYFRFGKLKCSITMKNAAGEEVCSALISGMIYEK